MDAISTRNMKSQKCCHLISLMQTVLLTPNIGLFNFFTGSDLCSLFESNLLPPEQLTTVVTHIRVENPNTMKVLNFLNDYHNWPRLQHLSLQSVQDVVIKWPYQQNLLLKISMDLRYCNRVTVNCPYGMIHSLTIHDCTHTIVDDSTQLSNLVHFHYTGRMRQSFRTSKDFCWFLRGLQQLKSLDLALDLTTFRKQTIHLKLPATCTSLKLKGIGVGSCTISSFQQVLLKQLHLVNFSHVLIIIPLKDLQDFIVNRIQDLRLSGERPRQLRNFHCEKTTELDLLRPRIPKRVSLELSGNTYFSLQNMNFDYLAIRIFVFDDHTRVDFHGSTIKELSLQIHIKNESSLELIGLDVNLLSIDSSSLSSKQHSPHSQVKIAFPNIRRIDHIGLLTDKSGRFITISPLTHPVLAKASELHSRQWINTVRRALQPISLTPPNKDLYEMSLASFEKKYQSQQKIQISQCQYTLAILERIQEQQTVLFELVRNQSNKNNKTRYLLNRALVLNFRPNNNFRGNEDLEKEYKESTFIIQELAQNIKEFLNNPNSSQSFVKFCSFIRTSYHRLQFLRKKVENLSMDYEQLCQQLLTETDTISTISRFQLFHEALYVVEILQNSMTRERIFTEQILTGSFLNGKQRIVPNVKLPFTYQLKHAIQRIAICQESLAMSGKEH